MSGGYNNPHYNNSGGPRGRGRGGFGRGNKIDHQGYQNQPAPSHSQGYYPQQVTAVPPYPQPAWRGDQNNPAPEYVGLQPQPSYPDPNQADIQQAQSADGRIWTVQSGGTSISQPGQSDGSHSGIKDGSKSHKRERSHSGGRQNEAQSTTTDRAQSDHKSRSNSGGNNRSQSGERSHGNDGEPSKAGNRDRPRSGDRSGQQNKQSTRWGPEHHRNDQRQQGHGGYPPAYASGYNDGYYDDSQQNYGNQQPNWNNSGNSYRQPRQQRGRDDDYTVFLSKQLSSILRHNAERFGLKLMKGGFIYVDDILNKVHKLRGYTNEDIHYVVDNNDKNRFTLEAEANGRLKIRANQGHTLEVEELDLKPILSADQFPRVIHGTYYTSWEAIKRTGLCRMKRNHMHFAAGEPGQDGVISGMRSSCEVMIYIDMEKALKDGLKFYLSSNNVILCPGNEDGYLFPCYFQGVKDRRGGYKIEFDQSISSLKRSSGQGKSETGKDPKKSKNNSKKSKEVKDWENNRGEKKPGQKKGKASTKQEDGEDYLQAASEMFPEDTEAPDQWDAAQADEPKGKVTEVADKQKDALDAGPKRRASADKGAEGTANKKDPLPWTTTPTILADVELSKSAVDHILKELSPSNVAVCCCGNGLGTEGSDITMMVVLARPEIYVYHFQDAQKQLMTEGGLKDLLMSKDCKKIFHNIGSVSLSLIQEFDILVNGVPITDISVLFGKSSVPEMEREKLEEKYGLKHAEMKKHIRSWEKENDELVKKLTSPDTIQEAINTLVERGKLMLELHDLCASVMSVELERALKKEVYQLAVPDKDGFLADKIAELKVAGRKKANKTKAPEEPEQAQASMPENQKQPGTTPKKKKGKKNKK